MMKDELLTSFFLTLTIYHSQFAINLMDFLLSIAGLFLAVIFGVAGIAKLFDRVGSEKALRDFGLSESLAKVFGGWLPIFEIALAFSLIFRESAWFAGISALVLLTIFCAAMAKLMLEGKSPDCHCFGQVHSAPVSWKSLARNAALALVALFVVIFGKGIVGFEVLNWLREMSGGEKVQVILSLGIVGLLAAAVLYLRKISEQQSLIIRRIELLEYFERSEREEIHDEFVLPSEGLPIGAISPMFALPNLDGQAISLENLLHKRKTAVLFFVAPNCAPCEALLPEIEVWKTEFAEKLTIVFVSSGSPKENRTKFGNNEVLLQTDDEVKVLFKSKWTPTAVLINVEGKIASRLAVGDTAIRELFERIRNQDDVQFVQNEKFGIAVGSPAPEVELLTVDGTVLNEELLKSKQNLMLFWSKVCPFCDEMLNDLREWEMSKNGNSPNLIVITDESEGLDLQSPIIADKEGIAKKLGKNGTPSAVLIDENWRFASEVAVGSDEIWSLIGK